MKHQFLPIDRLIRRAGLAIVCLLALAWHGTTRAQDGPKQPVTLLVSYPAGGVADLLARNLAGALSKSWGQPVVVDNRGGANQILALSAAMRSRPDGSTLLLCDDGAFTLNPVLFKKLPYTLNDFTPIAGLADAKILLSMSKEVPARDLAGLIAYAKQNPGRLNYATLGVGNIHHMMLETLQRQAGIELFHVPFKGYTDAINAVLGNQAQLVSGGIGGPVLGHIRNGNLRPLAVTGTSRSPLLPDVPTFAEAGLPRVQPQVHFILMGPAGMPDALRDRIGAATAVALNDIAATTLTPNGMEPLRMRAAELRDTLEAGQKMYAPLVKQLDLKLD